MNKKQLIIAAMATALTISAAHATNITGVTGNNGIYNIDPGMVSGDVGYRQYTDFDLSAGHTANLIFQGYKNGEIRNINSFINLVQNQIKVNGILNTMRGNNFFNGHAIFISPNGLTVGSSGVLNVGQLSVIAPTQNKFNELTSAYGTKDFETLNQVSKLRSTSVVNYGGNAPVDIAGTVIARNGVDIRGSQVNISGGIVNGVNNTELISSADRAKELFNSLVNTDGIATSNALNNKSLVIVKSGSGANAGINITGKVANLNNTETAITNHGDKGLSISGTVAGNGKLNVYNNTPNSALTISGTLANKNNPLSVSNKGTALNITSTAKLNTEDALEIVNNGTGKLTLAGSAISKGKTDIVNRSRGGMDITGTVGNTATPSVRIVNRGGELAFSGTATAAKSVSVRNEENATGMTLGGTVKAGEGILVHNKVGNANLNGNLTVTKGDIMVKNEGSGKLTTGTSSQINGNGNVAIKNTAAGGMELNGTVNNTGETAINNYAGDMTVAGTITNNGNMGIINRETAGKMTVNGNVTNTGKLKVVNAGTGKQTINGTVSNNGNMFVYTDGGSLEVNGTLKNENGNLYVASRKNSQGIYTSENSKIENKNGSLAIKHEGKAVNGMNLNGTVKNTAGEIAINNYAGNMHVGGTVTADRNLGIINRAGGNTMNVDAVINHTGNTANIKNYGSGDMTVNGEITHNGRLNVLANENKLILGGKIHNQGADMTYAAARANGTGIEVKNTFNADSANGLVMIKNITGQNGLKYDGTITNTNGQAEIYNKAGDMTVNGSINGQPAVVLNTGNNLTVNEAADLQGDVKILNKGKNAATVADKYKRYFREQLAQ